MKMQLIAAFNLLTVVLPIMGAALSKTVLYQAPDECRWTGSSESDIVLVCNLRTINSELENTNFSVIQSQNTVRLRLECSDALFFQSYLGPDSFKSLVELRSLTIEFCKLGNLVDGSFRGLEDLRNLTIRTHNSDWSALTLDVSASVFAEFRHLERLDLSLNNIRTIPDGMVCPLKRLTNLNLTQNEIQDLGNFHFSASLSTRKSRICGSSLSELILSRNRIANLPPAIFSALGRLRNLDLSRNDMSFIADRAFEGLLSLATVDLSDNKLTNLPPELFSEAKRVREIYLRNNSINVLAPGLFSELSELLVLDLSSNDLTSQWITPATFLGLKRLISLDLSSNKISKLESTLFAELRSLQVLKLQENFIDTIPENAFTELTNMHTLVLSNNRLTEIGQFTFLGLYGIAVLSLDYNRITKIDEFAFKNCSSLQDLHLNGNKLRTVPEALNFVPLLKTLDLGENLITNIQNTSLSKLSSLFGLRLTENLIDFIKRGIFDQMTALTILNLSRNRIKEVEVGSFDRNVQLQAIRLDGNGLNTIQGYFKALPNLLWLNISDNEMTTFDYSHIPASLQWLDIHANRITQIGNYFDAESSLALGTLDVSFNRLTEITASSIPNSVEELYLNDNEIVSIQSYTFFKKPNLTKVHLTGNKLTTLEPNAVRLSPVPDGLPIPEFYISGNPFQCDCNLDWIQKINTDTRTQPNLMDLPSIKCALSYSRGRTSIPLIETNSSELLCKYESHCFALCHCCDFAACDCKMECPDKCSCYHDHSWSSNVVDCSKARYDQELPQHIPMDSTQLLLDGNHLRELSSHSFIGRKRLRVLQLNNSHIEVIQNRTFYGLVELEILQLDHNQIERLNGNEFLGLDNLKELYLQYNRIATIEDLAFAQLHNLKVLRLEHNAIVEFEMWNLLPPYLTELHLAGNPWTCKCSFVRRFREYLQQNRFVKDSAQMRCSSNATGHALFDNQSKFCGLNNESSSASKETYKSNKMVLSPQPGLDYIPILVAIFASFLFVILITILVFIFRQKMRLWCYSHFGIRLFCKTTTDLDKNEREKLFDAFISYSSKDEPFVAQHLAPQLEHGDTRYKLCLHHRDFPVGGYIADTIVQAIDSSRRTIMVLSESFVKSEWCRFEFKSAHHQVMRDRRRRLIVILLGELPQKDLDPDIQLYLKTNTYLQWGDKNFWEKLRFALPDVPNNQRRTTCNAVAPSHAHNPNFHHIHAQQLQQHPQHNIHNLNLNRSFNNRQNHNRNSSANFPTQPQQHIPLQTQHNLHHSVPNVAAGMYPAHRNTALPMPMPSPRAAGGVHI